ncbi:DUF3352 domain-containing protein [Patescibacteria group bacterium]|nr:DUF3352 domain-containing protein [Patescibacteria group bacterium]MBU1563568.1 DUF3352 domain-containing protein [Patescibacteria group bacterium]MBU2068306.1 DUF3352 domain-containing protein [Patescibacteria group bacterium]
MSQIPITKIAKDSNIDLRKSQTGGESKQSSKKWLFLSLFLILIVVASGLNYWFLVSQRQSFADLIPKDATAYAIINQVDIYPQVSSLIQSLGEKSFFGQEAINRLNQYFNQAELSFSSDILPLFKSQAALITLPANNNTDLPFLIVLKKKGGLAEISQFLDKIKPEMNKDFNISIEDYRQISITLLSPILDSSVQYSYALIENYLIISNSQESLQEIIDSIISG